MPSAWQRKRPKVRDVPSPEYLQRLREIQSARKAAPAMGPKPRAYDPAARRARHLAAYKPKRKRLQDTLPSGKLPS